MRKLYLALFSYFFMALGNAQWTALTSGTTEHLQGVFAANDGVTAWAVGNNGTILKTTNGTTWIPQTDPQTYDNYDVFFLPDKQTGWIATGGGILKTTDGGTN